ncbi:MAG: hypothetical protein ACRDJO_12950 [Actinomycetota bacterium]
MTLRHLDLADFLLVAEDTLGIEAGYLATMCDLGRADAALNVTSAEWAGEPQHAGLAEKGAALFSRLVALPPVPARAAEVALACLFELAGRNGYRWVERAGDAQALGERIRSVTPTGSSEVSVLARWIADHLEPA